MTPLDRVSSLDRALGDRIRSAAAGSPGLVTGARVAAATMAPAFEFLVAAAVARRRTRAAGLVLLASAGGASLLALVIRDRLARPRPGARPEGGMPSRHAAAASAIATTLARRRSPLSVPAWGGLAVGGAARVVTGDHEPGDIVLGALLGAAVGSTLARLARVLVGWRR